MNQTNCTAQALIRLADFSLISVTGTDRIAFLQGQLTNDVTKLADGVLMTAGYCSPKGRLLATPRLFSVGETVYMIVTSDQVDVLLKRLKMFVLRSKVSLTKVEDLSVYATFDSTVKSSLGLTFELGHAASELSANLDLPQKRYLIIDKADRQANGCSCLFKASAIAAGQTWVGAQTADQFVPQAVNLECIGGISFTKGCYTGQEIVSRVEHIGKTNRRAAVGILDTDTAPTPMTDVVNADNKPCGCVIDSVCVNGKTVVMVQLNVGDIDNSSFKSTVNGVDLTLYNLPYAYARAQ